MLRYKIDNENLYPGNQKRIFKDCEKPLEDLKQLVLTIYPDIYIMIEEKIYLFWKIVRKKKIVEDGPLFDK